MKEKVTDLKKFINVLNCLIYFNLFDTKGVTVV